MLPGRARRHVTAGLLVSRLGQDGQALLHADSLDLYAANKRGAFVKLAAVELRVPEEVVKRDLGHLLLRLEEMQQESIRKAVEPRRKAVVLSEADRGAALAFLRDPGLVDRIVRDFERVGVVGEETNKLVAYLAAVSRKLDEPLAVVVQSNSAAGKTSLVDAALAFVPEEDRLRFSAITGKCLFYLGETDLQHRVLAVAEDQGAEPAAYAWKLLVSEGALTLASTGADKTTGRLVAREYKVRGPVALFLTSNQHRARRRTPEPRSHPGRRRGPAADPGHPPRPARAADAPGAAGAAGAGRHLEAAPGRPAAAPAARGREPLCAAVVLP